VPDIKRGRYTSTENLFITAVKPVQFQSVIPALKKFFCTLKVHQ